MSGMFAYFFGLWVFLLKLYNIISPEYHLFDKIFVPRSEFKLLPRSLGPEVIKLFHAQLS